MSTKIFFTLLVMAVFIACNDQKSQEVNNLTRDVTLSANKENAIYAADTTVAVAYEEQIKISDPETAPPPPPKQQPGSPQQKTKTPATSHSENKTDWNKKIIKTATLNLETADYDVFSKKISDAATRFGGYVADEQQTETEYKIENVLTLKVPVDQFQNTVDFLTTGETKINEKKITSEDVTTQYVDTKSRLEAKRAARMRYLDFLKQAKNMEEMLQVQNEIDAIQEEIESAAGRINYLSNASAMSTIHLIYYKVLNPSKEVDANPGFFKDVKNAFITGWKGVGEVVVGLMYLWPLILVVAVVVWYIRRVSFSKKATVAVVKK
jgi:Domain of unknown function (DUF4349)